MSLRLIPSSPDMSPEERAAHQLGELMGQMQGLVDVLGPAQPLWALGQAIADSAEARGDDGLAAVAEDIKRASRIINIAAEVMSWSLDAVDANTVAWLVAGCLGELGKGEFRPLTRASAQNVLSMFGVEPNEARIDKLIGAWR